MEPIDPRPLLAAKLEDVPETHVQGSPTPSPEYPDNQEGLPTPPPVHTNPADLTPVPWPFYRWNSFTGHAAFHVFA